MRGLFLLIFLIGSLPVFSQQSTISGKVQDRETGEPLEFTFDASVANSAMADEWVRKSTKKNTPDIPSMPGF